MVDGGVLVPTSWLPGADEGRLEISEADAELVTRSRDPDETSA